jgi:hypothetical protein
MISRALHLNVFEQPVKKYFFNNLIEEKRVLFYVSPVVSIYCDRP